MSLWKLYYHFVWATHQRKPLITRSREELLYQFIRHKTDELGGYVRAIGGIDDHVHLIVSIPPSLALAQYVHLIKGSSSRHMNSHCPDPNAPFKWQQEYGVFSISEKNLSIAIRYVNNQKTHHADSKLLSHLELDTLFSRLTPS
mgnify:CR=1 FL=1